MRKAGHIVGAIAGLAGGIAGGIARGGAESGAGRDPANMNNITVREPGFFNNIGRYITCGAVIAFDIGVAGTLGGFIGSTVVAAAFVNPATWIVGAGVIIGASAGAIGGAILGASTTPACQ